MSGQWTDAYIGIPFKEGGRDESGCDCAGLALLVLRREAEVEATDFRAYETADFNYPHGYAALSKSMDELMAEWAPVKEPQALDLVRFRYGRYPAHVGIWAGSGNLFLHVEKEGNFARLTPLTDLAWGPRFIEFRRHERLMGLPR